jgi:hypothetical protein
MKRLLSLLLHCVLCCTTIAVSAAGADGAAGRVKMQGRPAVEAHWALDSVRDKGWVAHGKMMEVDGVRGKALALDGGSVIELNDSAQLCAGADGFTFTVWVNPFAMGGEQRLIAAKNRYSMGEREWGVMVDTDGKFRLYLWQSGWKTVTRQAEPKPGHWHQVGIVVRGATAELWVNGELEGRVVLTQPLAVTDAPITLGGVNDKARRKQLLTGALDEARYWPRPLSAEEMTQGYKPVTATLPIPEPAKPLLSDTPLWDETQALLKSAELPVIEGARFSVIKPYAFAQDGYRFLHGVALCFHEGKLYASFGHNRGGENTDTEEARYTVSEDEGRTWSEVRTIDAGAEPGLGVSHGAFLSHQGTLWAFMGAYRGIMEGIHMRAYTLDEKGGRWQPKGVVIEGGFWPMQEPVKMDDGNWIMAGIKAGVYSDEGTHPAAVAISHGEDFTHWDLVVIPPAAGLKMWGESTVIVKGKQVMNVSRFGAEGRALVAVSGDYGRSWSKMLPGNLPMATSKPIAGMLSNGQRYLVCTTTADSGKRRAPLTLAVSKPGESVFSKVFVIRHAVFPDGPGESHERGSLSYPYAIEHDGHLYIGYSNNGGNAGRVGEGRELWNNNSAELAVIPIASLRVDDD